MGNIYRQHTYNKNKKNKFRNIDGRGISFTIYGR